MLEGLDDEEFPRGEKIDGPDVVEHAGDDQDQDAGDDGDDAGQRSPHRRLESSPLTGRPHRRRRWEPCPEPPALPLGRAGYAPGHVRVSGRDRPCGPPRCGELRRRWLGRGVPRVGAVTEPRPAPGGRHRPCRRGTADARGVAGKPALGALVAFVAGGAAFVGLDRMVAYVQRRLAENGDQSSAIFGGVSMGLSSDGVMIGTGPY